MEVGTLNIIVITSDMNCGICCGLSRFHVWLYVCTAWSSCMGKLQKLSLIWNKIEAFRIFTHGSAWPRARAALGVTPHLCAGFEYWVAVSRLFLTLNLHQISLLFTVTILSHMLGLYELWHMMERVTEVVKVKYLNVLFILLQLFWEM